MQPHQQRRQHTHFNRERIALLEGPQRHMDHHEPIGRIHPQMQRLPHRRGKKGQPEIMAGYRQEHQDQQRRHTERNERKPAQMARPGIGHQQRIERCQRAIGEIPPQHRHSMPRRQCAGDHAGMPTIIQQRQKPLIQPCERADGEHQGQQHKRAGPQRLDAQRLVIPRAEMHERREIHPHAQQQHRIIELLAGRPAHRHIAMTHSASPSRTASGAMIGPDSAQPSPSATGTSTASTSQATRCAAR